MSETSGIVIDQLVDSANNKLAKDIIIKQQPPDKRDNNNVAANNVERDELVALYRAIFSKPKHNYTIMYPYDASITTESTTTKLNTSGAVIILNGYKYSNMLKTFRLDKDGKPTETVQYICTELKEDADNTDEKLQEYRLRLTVADDHSLTKIEGMNDDGVYEMDTVGVTIVDKTGKTKVDKPHYQALLDIIDTSDLFPVESEQP
jgi:hypothetical protein